MHPTGPFDLPGLLATYRKRHPGVAIHMVEEVADDMLTLLRRDELDCAFASVDTDGIGEEFAATLLWQEELVVAAHPEHPFAAQEAVTLEQLAAEPLIAYRENSAIRQRLERALGGVGLRPEPAFVCTEMGAVRALASNGLGVAVMPRSVTEQPGPPVVARPLGPTALTWPVALVWRAARPSRPRPRPSWRSPSQRRPGRRSGRGRCGWPSAGPRSRRPGRRASSRRCHDVHRAPRGAGVIAVVAL